MPHVTVTVLIRRFSVYRIITNAGAAIRSGRMNPTSFPRPQTKVETQNFASPVQPVAVHTCNSLLPINAFLASHEQPIAIHAYNNLLPINSFLASPVPSISIHDCNNLLPINAFLARETQDFASLQADAIIFEFYHCFDNMLTSS